MSEEKKPTETEIICAAALRAREAMQALNAEIVPPSLHERSALWASLIDAVTVIERANEARDKSRKLSLDVSLYDFTEPMVKALLSQGFDLALQAVVPQLKTVRQGPGSLIAWNPPVNPFASQATDGSKPMHPRTSACTCPIDPPGAQRINPDCLEHNPVRACKCGYDHGDLGADGLCVRCGGRVT